MFMFDLALQSSELFLLPPVVEGGDEDDDDDGHQDGHTFDPTGLRFAFVMSNCGNKLSCCVSNGLSSLVRDSFDICPLQRVAACVGEW